jgi:hypothetical protein
MSDIVTKHSSHLLRIQVKKPTWLFGKDGDFRGFFEGLIVTDLGRQAIGLLASLISNLTECSSQHRIAATAPP